MVVIVFRSRLRPDVNVEELIVTGGRMYELASRMPGFHSYKDFSAEDGENLALVEFETMEQLSAWREHPEHREAQEAARSRYYAEYTVQVCELVRTSSHPAPE